MRPDFDDGLIVSVDDDGFTLKIDVPFDESPLVAYLMLGYSPPLPEEPNREPDRHTPA